MNYILVYQLFKCLYLESKCKYLERFCVNDRSGSLPQLVGVTITESMAPPQRVGEGETPKKNR
jgi:hypothetical protein